MNVIFAGPSRFGAGPVDYSVHWSGWPIHTKALIQTLSRWIISDIGRQLYELLPTKKMNY